MRKSHFLLIVMLLFTLIAVDFIIPTCADVNHGTRNPGAGVEITPPTNRTGKPTEKISYVFTVKNTGDENDSFYVSAHSQHGWLMNWTGPYTIGPLIVNETKPVTVNITIPMGIPANIRDNLTFSAQSLNQAGEKKETIINTTVIEAFVVSIDIEGRYNKTSSIDPPSHTNYTLTIRNKGNDNVTITLKHSTPRLGWDVTFPRYENRKVTVDEANLTHEGVVPVNITITAPINEKPDEQMTIFIWGEKTDIIQPWYSWQYQENVTITTIVQSRLAVNLSPENIKGFIGFYDTQFNFTMQNTGNKDITVDLIVKKEEDLITSLHYSQIGLIVGNPPIENWLMVHAASNTPLGNYSINVSAIDNLTGQFVGKMDLYFIIVPILNITNISFSDSEPLQYKSTNVYVTIDNIGYVDATDITVKLYDGSKKVAETKLDVINASDTVRAKIKWSPSDFGNRTIRVKIDVEGVGNFSLHGTDISENFVIVTVKINWQPYYLVIYVIIVIILGIATFASMLALRYYGGVPHLNHLGEGEEGIEYEEYPEEGELREPSELEEDRAFAAFGVSPKYEEPEDERPLYRKPRERPAIVPPVREKEAFEEEIYISKDPEIVRRENEIKDEMARIQDKLDKIKSLGVDTTNVSQLLKTAQKNLDDGDLDKAKQYLGYANERLDGLAAKRDEAIRAIKEAKEMLSQMRGTADTTIIENFLVKADSLLAEGNFREAINYANKAKERAVRLHRREMRL